MVWHLLRCDNSVYSRWKSRSGPTFLAKLRAQIDAGIDAIIIGGSLGESSTITHDERLEMLSSARSEFGKPIPFFNQHR
jgi:dihydrodipicolinate synthase/N-acetylneuraminate lyase